MSVIHQSSLPVLLPVSSFSIQQRPQGQSYTIWGKKNVFPNVFMDKLYSTSCFFPSMGSAYLKKTAFFGSTYPSNKQFPDAISFSYYMETQTTYCEKGLMFTIFYITFYWSISEITVFPDAEKLLS